jgi:hypothetical protein
MFIVKDFGRNKQSIRKVLYIFSIISTTGKNVISLSTKARLKRILFIKLETVSCKFLKDAEKLHSISELYTLFPC